MDKARKQDTHQKIQLGGLVVKAGLREEDKAVILGALIELSKQIQSNSPKIQDFKNAGDLAFMNEEKEE